MLSVPIVDALAGGTGSGEFTVEIAAAEIAGRLLTAQAVRRSMFNGTVVLADSSEYGTCREPPLFGNGFEGNQ